MASMTYSTLVSLFSHTILLLIISYPPNILSQNPSPSSPNTTPCPSSFLLLLTCAPFVQGAVPTPGSQCCGNLKQIYSQDPHCLCLLLNDTGFNSFPINRTLVLQIPTLCSIQVNNSVCPGQQTNVPSISPDSPVSFETRNNSTTAASPIFSVPPRPLMGLGFRKSEAIDLKTGKKRLIVVITITTLLFTLVSY